MVEVKLPGENKMIARPLKPVGSRFATSDWSVAEEVARDMWEHSVFESDRPVKDVHTIAELVRAYLEYAKNYYKGADGKVTREPENNKICSSFDGGVFFNAACRRVRAIET